MFRERLRATRENKDLSQIQMAEKLGIAVTTYRNYENTSREPNYEILVNIANVLDVSIDYLLGNDCKCNSNSINVILQKVSNLSDNSCKELNFYLDYLIYKEKTALGEKE